MEKNGEWVEGRIPASFGPIEGLTHALDQYNREGRGDPDQVYPVSVGLLRGDAKSFAARVAEFTRAVNESGFLGKSLKLPIVAIPPFHLGDNPNTGKYEKGDLKQSPDQKSAPETVEPNWISLLVTADFLMLLSVPDGVVQLENPINDVWQFSLSQHLPGDAIPSDANGDVVPLPDITLPNARPTKGIVITAVIDDGLPIANARFRAALTDSRVAYAWVQDGKFRPSGSHVHYGREFDKLDIDAVLNDAVVAGQVDEDKFYRLSGITNYADQPGRTRLGHRYTHGSNVLDQAAGYDWDTPPSFKSNPIIAVQLPQSVTADTSGLSLDAYVQDALHYILDRADRIAADLCDDSGQLPLVINFSYGYIAGPHDGTSPLEVLMDRIIKDRNAEREITAITLPAGNSRQVMCHGVIRGCKPGGPAHPDTLTWHVLPDDRTPSYAVLYMPVSVGPPASSRVKVRIKTPTGALSPALPEISGLSWEWRIETGPVLAKLSYQYLGLPTARGRFVITIHPTAQLDPNKPTVPSGNWLIGIENISLAADEIIEAYIQRDDTSFGYVERGRQSHFLDPDYERYTVQGMPVDTDNADAYVKRDGTLNGLATGHETAVIAGFDRIYGQPALYSAAGPALKDAAGTPGRVGPNVMGVSDTTRVHVGVLGAATRSGGVFGLSGTSVAAPEIARKIAHSMADGSWTGTPLLGSWVVSPLPPYWPNPLEPSRAGAGRVLTKPIYDVARVEQP